MKKIRSLIIVVMFLVSLLVAINPVSAAVHHVYSGQSIQAAINNASSGDTIIVHDGTYTENIDVNKDHLTIKSENGAEATIVYLIRGHPLPVVNDKVGE